MPRFVNVDHRGNRIAQPIFATQELAGRIGPFGDPLELHTREPHVDWYWLLERVTVTCTQDGAGVGATVAAYVDSKQGYLLDEAITANAQLVTRRAALFPGHRLIVVVTRAAGIDPAAAKDQVNVLVSYTAHPRNMSPPEAEI